MRKPKHAKRIAELTETIVDANKIIADRCATIAGLKDQHAQLNKELSEMRARATNAEKQLETSREAVTALKAELFQTKQSLAYVDGFNAHMKENEIVRELGAAIEAPSQSRRTHSANSTLRPDVQGMSLNAAASYSRQPKDWWDR